MLYLSFFGGLLLLFIGAEMFIKGASKIAELMGISAIVIGLTVVAYGTSTPELVVSVFSALKGQSGIALGNAIGSNNFNVLFILGLSATIIPLTAHQRLIQLEVPLFILMSFLTYLICMNHFLTRPEGIFLLLALVIYTAWVVYQSKNENDEVLEEYQREFKTQSSESLSIKSLFCTVALTVLGLLFLVIGARLLTQAASSFAVQLGLSEPVIGLTIVAAGTSFPELATSLLASARGDPDIAIGNVIGSSVFNIMGVLGLSATISGTAIEIPGGILNFDLPLMILVSIICLPILFTGHKISRWEGFLFLFFYGLYTASMIAEELYPDQFELSIEYLLLVFVLPLTIITLWVVLARFNSKNDPISN